MTRTIARWILGFLMIGSFGFAVFNVVVLWQNPTATVLVDRAEKEIAARIEKQLLVEATQENMEARVTVLLGETPRNWLVIEAIEAIAQTREIRFSPALQVERAATYDEDHGFLAASGKCLACMQNPASCELSAVLLCRAPIDLTPAGDIIGVVKESKNLLFGEEVDMFELGLSTIGLGATVLAPLTGGTSASIKMGTSIVKTAKRMGRLSPSLIRFVKNAVTEAIDWNQVARTRPQTFAADLGRAARPAAIRPLLSLVDNLAVINRSVGVPQTLHLLKAIDTPDDARAIARVAEVTRGRTVGVFELLGKNRIVRSALRYVDEVYGVIYGILGMLAAILASFYSFIGSVAARMLRAIASE